MRQIRRACAQDCYGRFSQVTLRGGVRSQAMLSVTPEATSAQALPVAVRSANSSVLPEAVRQDERPWKSMHTSTLYFASPRVA